MKRKLLVIEDEISVAKQLKWGLQKEYEVVIATDAEKAKQLLSSIVFPVAILDLGLPPFPENPRQGFELLRAIPSISPNTKVIVVTGNAEEENAIKSIALGAVDFCAKPVDLKILKIILDRTYRILELEEANLRLRRQESGSFCGMIGISPFMKKVFELIQLAAENDYPVLITGSTGTGKEMAAKAIHSLSSRAEKPFVAINCGAIPENLLENELFGHEKGAFTGAITRQIGKFERADGGTIFLDEIGEMSLSLQVKLLRFLQESTIERLGGGETITIDARVIAATNRDLREDIREGTFREDLFYRLNVTHIKLPDLKERREDILLLAHNFLSEESRRLNRGKTTFSPEALSALSTYEWPGNVRELQNRIKRALSTTKDRVICPYHLGFDGDISLREEKRLPTLKEAREDAERRVIQRALTLSGGNISKAAKLLGISRPTLHDLIKKHKINI